MKFSTRYGIDAPYWVTFFVICGLCLSLISLEGLPNSIGGFLFGLWFIGLGTWMFLYSTVIKIKHREVLLDLVKLQKEEELLDIGTGRGLLAIAAAKRGCKVTAIDKWSQWDLGGNGQKALIKNEKEEEVAGIQVLDGDACELPFAKESFDVVVSHFVIHNIKDQKDREKAVSEMWRVLRPGGKMLLSDIRHIKDYIKIIEPISSEMEIKRFKKTFPFSTAIVAKKTL